MSKRVLILVGIPNFDYSNEHSAVLSFLNTVKGAFEQLGYEVDFAGEQKVKNTVLPNTSVESGVKGKLKKILKQWNWLYQSIAFWNYFKQQDVLLNQLLEKKPYDAIVEFHTVGSFVGKRLAEKWDSEFSVIFDSPVDEQFYDMYGTKSMHWSRIVRSEKETLEYAKRIMVYSPECGNYINKRYQIKGAVNVLPCVIEKKAVKNEASNDSFNISFIGSFLSWHKVEMLVKAFKQFQGKHSEARLQLIGYGQEWHKIKAAVLELKLQEVVELPGFVSEEELLEYKKRSSVAVMPGSNWYGSPLKLFEYAQCEIPFIAPVTPTVSSVFEKDEHCLYIDPNDEQASLLKQLVYAYDNKVEMKNMAKRAFTHVATNYGESIYQKKLLETLSVD